MLWNLWNLWNLWFIMKPQPSIVPLKFNIFKSFKFFWVGAILHAWIIQLAPNPFGSISSLFHNNIAVTRWKSKLCVGNSSVIKIYIIRPKPGPIAKNATPRPSGWESNVPASSELLDQCSTTELQKPLLTTWARVQYIY